MIDPNTVFELLGEVMVDDKSIGKLPSKPEQGRGKVIEGFVYSYLVDVEKLEKDRDIVRSWIAMLPTEFLAEGGGGWTALNLQQTGAGEQWGEQIDGERLYVLAAALGIAKPVLPRAMWSAFPGGMPYVVFTLRDTID